MLIEHESQATTTTPAYSISCHVLAALLRLTANVTTDQAFGPLLAAQSDVWGSLFDLLSELQHTVQQHELQRTGQQHDDLLLHALAVASNLAYWSLGSGVSANASDK